jgi:3-deoxy-7-phosphoheptulonate synthase
MIIVLKRDASKSDSDEILNLISEKGLKPLYLPGVERVVLGAIGDERVLGSLHLQNHPMVEEVKEILAPYKLVSREMQAEDSVVKIGGVPFGGKHFTVAAGPCAIESLEQLQQAAAAVKAAGATCMRGGAYKPRTSPYSFQGLELEGLKILAQVSKEFSIPSITEVVEVADVEAVEEYADAFQVGARNMQNFRLLKALGQSSKPVILKRGMSAKVEDLLLAAEYIMAEGNTNVILCERGIRTFETCTRNTLDLNAIPYIKQKTHLPVIVDPSHGTGVRSFVTPMALAAAACGADGIIVEVHPNPKVALSDGQQSLFPEQFAKLMQQLKPILEVLGKELV